MSKFRFLTAVITTVFLTVFLCTATAAISIPQPSADYYVYDEVEAISEETREQIITQNEKLFYSTGSQIVFTVVETIGDTDIRDYTKKMFVEWDIGDSEKHNGILVLIAIKEDNYWVIPGTGIDDKLTTDKLKSMTDNYLEPYFLSKDYDRGVRTLFDKLSEEVAGIYGEDLTKVVLPEGGIDPNGNPRESDSSVGTVLLTIFLVIVGIAILAVVGLIVFRNISESRYRRKNYKPAVRLAPGQKRLPAARPPRQNPNNQGVPRQGMPRQNPNGQRPAQRPAAAQGQNQRMPARQNPMPMQNQGAQRQGAVPRQNQGMPRPNQGMPRQNPRNRQG